MSNLKSWLVIVLFGALLGVSGLAPAQHEGHGGGGDEAAQSDEDEDAEQAADQDRGLEEHYSHMEALLKRMAAQLEKIQQTQDADERDWYTERHRRTVREYMRILGAGQGMGMMGGKGGMKAKMMKGKKKSGMGCMKMGAGKDKSAAADHSAHSGGDEGEDSASAKKQAMKKGHKCGCCAMQRKTSDAEENAAEVTGDEAAAQPLAAVDDEEDESHSALVQ